MANKAPKTINNVLTVLSVLLKAVEWGVIERMPCTIKQLNVPKPSTSFYDFEEYERLVRAAAATDGRAYLITLLGAEAGGVVSRRREPLTEKVVQRLLAQAARRAGVSNNGPHILRHTFCSHLAMKGAAPRAIQELAGHSELSTTQRYLHLSPAAIENAIRLLDGNMVTTALAGSANTGS